MGKFANGKRSAALLGLLAIWTLALEGCVEGNPAPHALSAPARWYKGNTHAHTVLCGHADSTPKAVAKWYHDRGYNFLILSEHNKFIDPKTVKMPAPKREDYILVPGEEVTGRKVIHTTAMNISRLVPWNFDHKDKSAIIQNHADGVVAAGGAPILNHPNFKWALRAADMLPVTRLHMFELYNGHPSVHNEGDAKHPSTEALWDTLLTAGMVLYGVASDDAHQFKTWAHRRSNPGRGWVMVRAGALTPRALTDAMLAGDFYASSGVILKMVVRGPTEYRVSADEAATAKEVASPVLFGRAVADGKPGWEIAFIGPKGETIKRVNSADGTVKVTERHAYVRAKITLRRRGETGVIEYCAWTQPVFTDGRLAKLELEGAPRQP